MVSKTTTGIVLQTAGLLPAFWSGMYIGYDALKYGSSISQNMQNLLMYGPVMCSVALGALAGVFHNQAALEKLAEGESTHSEGPSIVLTSIITGAGAAGLEWFAYSFVDYIAKHNS